LFDDPSSDEALNQGREGLCGGSKEIRQIYDMRGGSWLREEIEGVPLDGRTFRVSKHIPAQEAKGSRYSTNLSHRRGVPWELGGRFGAKGIVKFAEQRDE
jgi:hypothetical protein